MSAVNTHAWEQTKENAAPLQRGRNVSALERAAALSPEETEEKINLYEKLVRPSEPPHITSMENDPLGHWLDYIKYYQSAFPSDTCEQFLLMERCTRALVKMKQYADDDRFIGVCAKYADKTKDPRQVFKYLHQQKVGANTALFWIAWAYVAEKDGDFPFAEQIFKKGISKNAQPLQMLKLRHKQFQRRMSRHWLNASATNAHLDEDDEEVAPNPRQRGALGGLSRDRLRTNDRTRSTRLSDRSRSTIGLPNAPTQGGFAILVEQEGENVENGYSLDYSGPEKTRVLSREADRRKENTLAAERWNERGGLSNPRSRKPQPLRNKGPPLAFPVFVDEECAAQHEQEAKDQESHTERHRQARDERTFRERTEEETAEKLARDPLRYVLNPSQREVDLAAADDGRGRDAEAVKRPEKERRSKIGFDKRLLKNKRGEEQCFEEARVESKSYTLFPSSENFNLLKKVKEDTSQMDCDEGGSFDASMTESEAPSFHTTASITGPHAHHKMEDRKEGKLCFRTEPSFEGSMNQTAISTASSTVHATDAVGLPLKREEETINTKFAMKELSMMFSSPAFGVDDVAKKTERQTSRINRSVLGEGVDVSFDEIGHMLGNAELNNSITNIGSTNDENQGPRNPMARSIGNPDIDQMALQEVESDVQNAASLRCNSRSQTGPLQVSQENPLGGPEIPFSQSAGFPIFEDAETDGSGINEHVRDGDSEGPRCENDAKASGSLGFTIFQDDSDVGEEEPRGRIQRICHEASENGDTASLSLFGDAVSRIDSEDDAGSLEGADGTVGDTATSSLFKEVFQEAKRKPKSQGSEAFSIFVDEDDTGNDAGDTATSSLFNQALGKTKQKTKPPKPALGGFSIFVEGEDDLDQGDALLATTSLDNSCSTGEPRNETDKKATDYTFVHDRDVRLALRQVHASASVASNSKTPLSSLLAGNGKMYNLPHVVLPREFRRTFLKGKTTVKVGKHAGMVTKELGRGAYGVVVLMESEDGDKADAIAVKVQSPTDCLAWEYDILRRVEQRVSSRCSVASYPFPRALSLVSLSDGGMFGMTTGSKSGLNLVDLVNVYKNQSSGSVPELLALHYTSKMLQLVELLHWHGKVLHCDIKPDNFVLSDASTTETGGVKYSNLVLVDFGRAVDMEGFSEEYKDVRKVRLTGDASRGDMRCVAMRNGMPWSYDVDTYGILCSAHVLLFGSHMELRKKGDAEWHPTKRLKRYWKQTLWDDLIRSVLNLDDDSGPAIGSHARSLRSIRERIDAYLEEQQQQLLSLLERQVHLLPSCREKI